jgi:hypothetical protein
VELVLPSGATGDPDGGRSDLDILTIGCGVPWTGGSDGLVMTRLEPALRWRTAYRGFTAGGVTAELIAIFESAMDFAHDVVDSRRGLRKLESRPTETLGPFDLSHLTANPLIVQQKLLFQNIKTWNLIFVPRGFAQRYGCRSARHLAVSLRLANDAVTAIRMASVREATQFVRHVWPCAYLFYVRNPFSSLPRPVMTRSIEELGIVVHSYNAVECCKSQEPFGYRPSRPIVVR